ncbi:MAG: amidohydrolase family protein [Bacteroidales bacterium]|nr:amidohydrolase family protein [Bacteroidales bacterium]
MIIDGHAHACGIFLKADTIISKLNQNGVDKVIIVPGEHESNKNYYLPNLTRILPRKNLLKITNKLTSFFIKNSGIIKHIAADNECVYNLSRETNNRVIQFVWITQQTKNPIEYLNEKFKLWNFKGIKLHQCWESFTIDSEFFKSVAQWAEENNLPLFIHLHSDNDVKALINYKRTHPKLKLIIAHLFGLEIFINQNVKDSNIYFDISPMQLISTYRIMSAIKFAGANNILLGSDTPYGQNSMKKNIARVMNLNISEKDKKQILGKNMQRLLNI